MTRFLRDLLHGLGDDFLLGDGRLLVFAGNDARGGPGKKLTRAGAGGNHEFERVGQFASINHYLLSRGAPPPTLLLRAFALRNGSWLSCMPAWPQAPSPFPFSRET